MAQSKAPGTEFYRVGYQPPPLTEQDYLDSLEKTYQEMEDEPEGQAQVAVYIQEYREYVDSGRYLTELPPRKPKVMHERVDKQLEEADEICRLNLAKDPERQARIAANPLPYENYP